MSKLHLATDIQARQQCTEANAKILSPTVNSVFENMFACTIIKSQCSQNA